MNLADPAILQRFLASQGIKATKGLGQHFLCSETVVGAIVDQVRHCNGILEIGPGPGVLTAPLVEIAERVVALEVDERMVRALRSSAPSAEVLKIDALNIDLSTILDRLPTPRAVVSNLPYYITAPLIESIARARASYDSAVLMMQREVARRILAPPRSGERGSISVYLQAAFEVSCVTEVPAAAFVPPPKVDSTVLAFRPTPDFEHNEALFNFVRVCFTLPRKTLVNNLMAGLHFPRDRAQKLVEEAGLVPLARAQELTLEEWIRLHTRATNA